MLNNQEQVGMDTVTSLKMNSVSDMRTQKRLQMIRQGRELDKMVLRKSFEANNDY